MVASCHTKPKKYATGLGRAAMKNIDDSSGPVVVEQHRQKQYISANERHRNMEEKIQGPPAFEKRY